MTGVLGQRDYVSRATASASDCARGTNESTTMNSSGVCALARPARDRANGRRAERRR